MKWIGLALAIAPVAVLLTLMTIVAFKDDGWRGPATFWAMVAAISAPVIAGVWLMEHAGG